MPRWCLLLGLPFLAVANLVAGQSPAPVGGPAKSVDTPAAAKPSDASSQEPGPEAAAPKLKPADLEKRAPLGNATKMQLIRVVQSEFVHARKYFPLGDKSIAIESDGDIKPGDAQLYQKAQTYGAAAKIGDKVQITNILFRDKSIYIEINGGPKKKTKWYNHIQLSMGGSASGTDPNQAQPTGAAMTVEFKQHIPEMTGAELKLLLAPVLDFSVKSASEVYVDTLPPKIRAAIKSHEVLVGMNRDMVVMAKEGGTQRKIREKDDKGEEYEEWLYGSPPADVVFVRFKGDEVIQVKTAKVSGEIIVKKEKEVDVKDGVASLASLKASESPEDHKNQAPPPEQPAHRPTLRRPDEQPDPIVTRVPVVQQQPGQHPEEPEWGKKPHQRDPDEPEDDKKQPPPELKPQR